MNQKWAIILHGDAGYKVSNLGEVLSPSGSYLKPYKSKKGYLIVDIKRKRLKVHRLVAMAFLTKPDGYDFVNHKDGDKTNNHYLNLEWCTNKQNIQHAYVIGLNRGRPGGENGRAKLVLDTQTGIFYDCAVDAANAKNMKPTTLYAKLSGYNPNNTSMIYV